MKLEHLYPSKESNSTFLGKISIVPQQKYKNLEGGECYIVGQIIVTVFLKDRFQIFS